MKLLYCNEEMHGHILEEETDLADWVYVDGDKHVCLYFGRTWTVSLTQDEFLTICDKVLKKEKV